MLRGHKLELNNNLFKFGKMGVVNLKKGNEVTHRNGKRQKNEN
jgi:hypothetical protein